MAIDLSRYNVDFSPKQPQQSTGGGIASYTSEAGGLLGGLLGSIGGAPGAVLGATIGGGAGQALENKLLGKKQTVGSIAGEAALSGGGELLGLGIGKLLTKGVSKVADKGAVSLIKKAYKPSASAIKKSAFNSVDDFARYVAQNNKNLSEPAIKALQSQYDDIALNSGAKTSVGKFISRLTKEAQETAARVPQKDKAFSKQIFQEIDNLQTALGKGKVDIGDLTQIRRNYDAAVKNFGKDELTDISLWMRNRLAKEINNVADSAGIKAGGQSLGKIGKALNKAYSASEIINNAVERGSTRSLLNLPAMVGGTVGGAGGGAVGGVPGAVVGGALGSAAGNPAVIGGTANLLTKLGSVAGRGMGPIGSNVAGSLGQAVLNREATPTEAAPLSTNLQSQSISPAESLQSLQTPQEPQLDKTFFTKAIFNDFAQTGGKNVSQIMAVAKFLGADQEQKQTKLSDAAITKINDVQGALADLEGLSATLKANPGKTGAYGIGAVQALIPGSQTQILQADINRIKQRVGKALEGGVLRKEDEEKYKKILPTINDSPNVAQAKINQLTSMLARDMQSYIQLQQSIGGGGDSLGNLLQQFSSQQTSAD